MSIETTTPAEATPPPAVDVSTLEGPAMAQELMKAVGWRIERRSILGTEGHELVSPNGHCVPSCPFDDVDRCWAWVLGEIEGSPMHLPRPDIDAGVAKKLLLTTCSERGWSYIDVLSKGRVIQVRILWGYSILATQEQPVGDAGTEAAYCLAVCRALLTALRITGSAK